MNGYETLLCVGGPHDGRWISILSIAPSIRFPSTEKAMPTLEIDVRKTVFRDPAYHRVRFELHDGSYVQVLGFEGLTATDVAARLVAGYHPTEQTAA